MPSNPLRPPATPPVAPPTIPPVGPAARSPSRDPFSIPPGTPWAKAAAGISTVAASSEAMTVRFIVYPHMLGSARQANGARLVPFARLESLGSNRELIGQQSICWLQIDQFRRL